MKCYEAVWNDYLGDYIMRGNCPTSSSQTQIIAALDKVCNILPSTFKSQCIDFLNSNGAAILDLLANELSPKKICAALGVCPPSKVRANGDCFLQLGLQLLKRMFGCSYRSEKGSKILTWLLIVKLWRYEIWGILSWLIFFTLLTDS